MALGVVLLIVTGVMTVVAIPTGLGENLQYITFISHMALVLTALDIIWTSRANEKLAEKEEQS